MRKLVLILTGIALLSSCGTVNGTVNTTPATVSSKLLSLKQKAYDYGKLIGEKVGFREGYETEAQNLKAHVKLWEIDSLSLKAGEYLTKMGIISKPEIFTLKEGRTQVAFDVKGTEFRLNRSKKVFSVPVPTLPSSVSFKTPAPYSAYLSSPDVQFYLNSYSMPIEKIGFELGFKAGYSEGVIKGEREAYKDALAVLEKKKRLITAVEVSKYYSLNSFLTYPRVFKLFDGKSYRYVVVSPRVEMPRTLKDVLNYNPDYYVSLRQKTETEKSIALPDTFEKTNPVPTSSVPPLVKVKVKPESVRILEKLSIPYEISDDGYRAVFHSKREAEEFCRKYKACVGGN